MKKILPFLKGSRYKCILAPLFKMFEATLELIVPLIVAEIIDNGIANGDKNYIIKLALQLVILSFTGLVFSLTAQYFAASAAVSTVKKLKHSVYEKIQNLSFSQYDSNGSSTLITRLTSDMDSVQNGINLTLRLLLRSPFVVAGACIMAFIVDFKSSGSFAVSVPLLSIVIFGIMALTVPLYKKVRSSLDGLLLTTKESVTGARVIRAFNIQENQKAEFTAKNNKLTEIQEKTGRISALLNPLTCLIINTAIAVLIWTGAKRVNSGAITCGTVVALHNYMSQILVELVKLANLIVTLTKSVACAGRISDLLDIPEEIKNEPASDSKDDSYLRFDNVSFAYNGAGDLSLKNISFSVKEGEKIGIIGSTGSGKSTLISLIEGFYQPTEGHIYLEGNDISSMSEKQLRSKIAFTEQKPVIFKGTIKSNLTLGDENISEERLISALKNAQAISFVTEKENGMNSITEQNGRNFSGGQRQRLAVARALAKDADILILDDASSALDYMTESEMIKAVSSLEYKSLILVSQRTGSIMNCDKIILLEDGSATVGTHEELLRNSEVYREIHLSQFEGEEEAV